MPATLFVCIGFDDGWIIEKIAHQLRATMGQLGVEARIGLAEDYSGELIVFQTRFLYARAYSQAVVNSVFVTHIDDRLKEAEVAALKGVADSFVCMAPEDAAFLRGLQFPADRVLGLDLPVFDPALEPIKLGIFSKRYADGRKNEKWLLNWTESNPTARDGIYFSFIGSGWLPVAEILEKAGWSVEVLSLNHCLSSEYEIQLRSLRSVDAYLYMGFDGGALGSYDAFKAGVPLFVSQTSYHHGIPGVRGMFKDEPEFHAILGGFARDWASRRAYLSARSMTEYGKQLLRHWAACAERKGWPAALYPSSIYQDVPTPRPSQLGDTAARDIYRQHYQPLSIRRALGTAKRFFKRLF